MPIMKGITDDSLVGTSADPGAAPPADPSTSNMADAGWKELLQDKRWDAVYAANTAAPVDEPAPVEPAPAADAPPAQPVAPSDDASAAPADQSAAPTGEEPAPEPTPQADEPAPADEEPPPFDPNEVARLMSENIQLKRLKGRQGQKLGEAEQRIAELQSRLEALEAGRTQAEPSTTPQNAEDLAAALLADPDRVIADRVERALAQKLRDEEQRVAVEQMNAALESTPVVALQLFANRHADIKDITKWSQSDEWAAVQKIINNDPVSYRAITHSMQNADPLGVAEVMSRALRTHRAISHARDAKAKQGAEKARIESTKPRAIPQASSAPPPPVAASRPRTINDVSFQDLLDPNKVSDAELLKLGL